MNPQMPPIVEGYTMLYHTCSVILGMACWVINIRSYPHDVYPHEQITINIPIHQYDLKLSQGALASLEPGEAGHVSPISMVNGLV